MTLGVSTVRPVSLGWRLAVVEATHSRNAAVIVSRVYGFQRSLLGPFVKGCGGMCLANCSSASFPSQRSRWPKVMLAASSRSIAIVISIRFDVTPITITRTAAHSNTCLLSAGADAKG
jgi:hypothetical protein